MEVGSTSGCSVTNEQLREFLTCVDDEQSTISAHVGQCESCEQKLNVLANGGLEIADRLQLLSRQTMSDDSIVALQESIMIPQKDRFEIQSQIAKGGMGVVVRARDKILRRDVALKIIKSGVVQNSEAVSRFVQEARISAILQHPGVVPIHDLGLMDNEQPFLAMKLIEGQTLSRMIEVKTPQPRLLEVFAQICQTLAYVHSKNVIHRDLKPANIMVGEFGEVQVTDWGLAKVLGAKEVPFASSGIQKPHFDLKEVTRSLNEASTDSDWQTQAGEIIGTVVYMPPEQALGQIEKLDKRSDVFALGAMLCEILTGRPPCGDLPIEQALEFAQKPNYSALHQRLEKSGQDRELVELAKQCLVVDVEQRPTDARVVSDALTEWRVSTQERLREVEINLAKAETVALTEKKRRRMASAFAIAILALVATVSSGLLYLGQQKESEFAAEQKRQQKALESEGKISRYLSEASLKRKAAIESKDPATWLGVLQAVELAQNLIDEDTGPDLRQLVGNMHEDTIQQISIAERLKTESRRQSETISLLKSASETFSSQKYRPLEELDGRKGVVQFEKAFERYGITVEGSLDESEVLFRAAPSQLKEAFTLGLYEWHLAYHRYNKPAGNYDTWLQGMFERLDSNPQRMEMRNACLQDDADLVGVLLKDNKSIGELEFLLALDFYAEKNMRAEQRAVLQQAVIMHPNSFWLNFDLAADYVNVAPVMLDSAMRHYLVCAALRPNNVQVQADVGSVMIKQNRYLQALRQFQRLVKQFPEFAPIHVNLGAMYMVTGSLDKAVKHLNVAVDLDPTLIQAYVNLGDVNSMLQNFDAANEAFEKALELDSKHPDVYVSMATISNFRGRLDEATKTLDKLFAIDPGNKRGLSIQANVQLQRGDLGDAEKTMQKVIAMSPQDTGQYVNLSIIQRMQKKYDVAMATLEKAERIDPSDYRIPRAMGNQYKLQRERGKAEKFFKKARALKRNSNLPEDSGK